MTKYTETQRKILEVGKEEFLAKGFKDASLRGIVKAAGFTQGAFYGYYPDKAALFDALVSEAADTLMEQFKAAQRAHYDLITEEKTAQSQELSTNYLNYFIKCAHEGIFPGLNNAKLRSFGKLQKLYPGTLEFFRKTKNMFRNDASYSEYDIQVEHYIVSTGFAEVIRGMELMNYVDDVWGCELMEAPDADNQPLINEIVYTIDNTTKTRAIFEINKGIGKIDGIDVNSKIPQELRRVKFENMIYIADGPSDIPAFSLVHQNGGSTFAIYPKGDVAAMKQVEQMRADGRVDMYAEADYSENTTANMWITNRIQELADKIREREKNKIEKYAGGVPRHLV